MTFCKVFASALAFSLLPLFSPASFAQTASKVIALTFDDGPNTLTTAQVLDKLDRYHVNASFFVCGSHITNQSATVMKRAFNAGNEICNHSYSHSHMDRLTRSEVEEEIWKTDLLIEVITGRKPEFFRAPYIDISREMYDWIDLTFINGEACQDWDPEIPAEFRAQEQVRKATNGGIILMHDFMNNDKTVQALDLLIPALQEQGYEFVTISELFRRMGTVPEPGILYSHTYDTERYYTKSTY